jgi:hypothetical protein
MKRTLASVFLALAAATAAQSAEVWEVPYGTDKTVYFPLYDSSGALDVDEVDGGSEVTLSCDGATFTAATNDFVDEGTIYSLALTAAETSCEVLAVSVAATDLNVFFVKTKGHVDSFDPPTILDGIKYSGLMDSYDDITGEVTLASSAPFPTGTLDNNLMAACSATLGYCQERRISTNTGDVVLLEAPFFVEPTGVTAIAIYPVYDSESSSVASLTENEWVALRIILGIDDDSATPIAPTDGALDDLIDMLGTVATKTSALPDDPADASVIAAAIAALPAAIRDLSIEDQGGGISVGCAIAVTLAYVAGDLATTAGAFVHEDPSGTETRISGDIASEGNRTAAVTCPTY